MIIPFSRTRETGNEKCEEARKCTVIGAYEVALDYAKQRKQFGKLIVGELITVEGAFL
ncbi:hypothetical protein [Amycolatopsis sacchari]|uniref:hypothetical protein n=1 Tax=Amycolatopsis sacchari TaxID=115433 RepID=UPI003D713E4A